jgi:hypothetical protein
MMTAVSFRPRSSGGVRYDVFEQHGLSSIFGIRDFGIGTRYYSGMALVLMIGGDVLS